MKKVFFSIGLGLLSFFSMQAQEARFGLKGGVNLANIVGDLENTDTRTSFHVGGVAEIPLAQDFFFGPEILYSSQGTKSNETEVVIGETFTSDITLKLDYITVPLMFKYYVADNFSLDLGPQVGFLISAKQEFETNSAGVISSGTLDVKDSASGFDYGLNIGLGYRLQNGLFFQGRYNIGLANIYDSPNDDDAKAQNSVIQVSLGFMF
ncbi:MAG: PorT family protein [Flavobacteriales bacterium]|nr:PorT family protein [Flavobacteriales bacterium]